MTVYPEGRRLIGSYALPFEGCDEQVQTCRLDRVLDYASGFVYCAERDAYRSEDAQDGSPDFAPADAVEKRRKIRDRRAREAP